ncbi:SDR family oxidoreductase [Chitinasiproducens palmae]|uniref:NAD(P)-dependent dehydrogenase, short-chain alcohol dehydrogenase family n=1 Tax=Chitinasiproducens palmae TaxID=1770053 RepID=A0A1H2PLI9_9BURK|nr:SDR family oxidoreductase [Chitinasiproducens palmae]SDV47325.1 NAD(P)-dependent dehydrogenase, short-chain alcohol dehydrogenase family [Chitinasiproducens palmae]
MANTLIITGGGRGIGAATAKLAASHGYAVCIAYRSDTEAAEAVVRSITADGGNATAVKMDVANEAEVIDLFESAERRLGPIVGLVNNAAIVAHHSRVEDISLERLQRMFAVNAIGPFLCSREAVRRMSTRRGGAGGAIVNVSSSSAQLGSPNEYVDYAASKGALESMTYGLAKEVAREGIRVNGVRPGPIYTEMHASGGEPDRVERVAASVPMGRGGRPEEVAEAIIWLLSDKASFATGGFINVNGGK